MSTSEKETDGSGNINSAFVHLFAGAFAGLLSDFGVHPIDTIRVRLQLYRTERNLGSSSSISSQSGRSVSRTSATRTFFAILRNEGISALYKGFSAVAAGTIPGHALYFYGYEFSKHHLNSYFKVKSDSNPLVHLASGVIADVYGSLAWCPMDVIKQRMQAQVSPIDQNQQVSGTNVSRYKSSMDAVRVIIKEEGPLGLFRGYWAALLAYAPFVSLYFALYEQLKIFSSFTLWISERQSQLESQYTRFSQHPDEIYNDLRMSKIPTPQRLSVHELPFYCYLGSAAAASYIAALLTNPLAVIKTRIQVNQEGLVPYKGIWNAMIRIQKEEGFLTFFNGVKARSLWIAGGTSLTMLFYEELKIFSRYLQTRNIFSTKSYRNDNLTRFK
jgi:hypothetical protein